MLSQSVERFAREQLEVLLDSIRESPASLGPVVCQSRVFSLSISSPSGVKKRTDPVSRSMSILSLLVRMWNPASSDEEVNAAPAHGRITVGTTVLSVMTVALARICTTRSEQTST
jgi:hypothetical protein